MDPDTLFAFLSIPLLSTLGFLWTHRSAHHIHAHRDAWLEALKLLTETRTHHNLTQASLQGISLRITHTSPIRGLSRAKRVSFQWTEHTTQHTAHFHLASKDALTPPILPKNTTLLNTGDLVFDRVFTLVTSRKHTARTLALFPWTVRDALMQLYESTPARITLDTRSLTLHNTHTITSARVFCDVLLLGSRAMRALQEAHEKVLYPTPSCRFSTEFEDV